VQILRLAPSTKSLGLADNTPA